MPSSPETDFSAFTHSSSSGIGSGKPASKQQPTETNRDLAS